jgi:hypothetical protein
LVLVRDRRVTGLVALARRAARFSDLFDDG